MASRNVSILLNRFSYGNVGTWTRSSSNAEFMLLQNYSVILFQIKFIFIWKNRTHLELNEWFVFFHDQLQFVAELVAVVVASCTASCIHRTLTRKNFGQRRCYYQHCYYCCSYFAVYAKHPHSNSPAMMSMWTVNPSNLLFFDFIFRLKIMLFLCVGKMLPVWWWWWWWWCCGIWVYWECWWRILFDGMLHSDVDARGNKVTLTPLFRLPPMPTAPAILPMLSIGVKCWPA